MREKLIRERRVPDGHMPTSRIRKTQKLEKMLREKRIANSRDG